MVTGDDLLLALADQKIIEKEAKKAIRYLKDIKALVPEVYVDKAK